MKFLIIQTAFIGDVILATPIIEKLHRFFPDCSIDFLLRKGNEDVLTNHPYISKIIIWQKQENKYTNLRKVIQEVREEKYDVVINLQRFFSTGFITVFSKGKLKIGFDKNPLSWFFNQKVTHLLSNCHEVERNLSLIAKITDDSLVLPKLYPSKEDIKHVEPFKKSPYICLAPTSVWHTKQLPEDKWIQIIRKTDKNIFLIGSKTDKQTCEQIIRNAAKDNVYNLSGKLSLLQSAALMQDAEMNYVNDSAPLHIASAMNAPTVAYFCSTSPQFGFGPLADLSKVVQSKENLSCKPCGIHGKTTCPKGHFLCATSIEIDESTN